MHVTQKYVYVLQESGRIYTAVDTASLKTTPKEDENLLHHGHLSFTLGCELPEEFQTH